MIITESYGDNLVRTYSDKGVFIHGGMPEGDYAEAIDPVEFNRVYTETNIPIPSEDADSSEAEEILDIILGENQ